MAAKRSPSAAALPPRGGPRPASAQPGNPGPPPPPPPAAAPRPAAAQRANPAPQPAGLPWRAGQGDMLKPLRGHGPAAADLPTRASRWQQPANPLPGDDLPAIAP